MTTQHGPMSSRPEGHDGRFRKLSLTPARTLVISRMRRPARGSLAGSGRLVDTVARARGRESHGHNGDGDGVLGKYLVKRRPFLASDLPSEEANAMLLSSNTRHDLREGGLVTFWVPGQHLVATMMPTGSSFPWARWTLLHLGCVRLLRRRAPATELN